MEDRFVIEMKDTSYFVGCVVEVKVERWFVGDVFWIWRFVGR